MWPEGSGNVSKIRNIFRGKHKYVTVKPTLGAPQGQVKREMPDGLWCKCPQCKALIFRKDLERACCVCEKCNYHFPINAFERLAQLVDNVQAFEEFDADLVAGNPLNFPDYDAKKERDAKKTNMRDAVLTGRATINSHPVILAIMEFGFIGGSMGAVVGERITRAFERAGAEGLPIIVCASSGGARMQEGIISLLQMQKTAAAVEMHSRAGLLFISVLVNPTTAGVYGSFASQGDIVVAEPGATVGFAGRPVIEAAVGKRVPPDLQKAETVFQNGFIDMIVPRHQLRATITRLLELHGVPKLAAEHAEEVVPTPVEVAALEQVAAIEPSLEQTATLELPTAAGAAPVRTPRSRLRRKKEA